MPFPGPLPSLCVAYHKVELCLYLGNHLFMSILVPRRYKPDRNNDSSFTQRASMQEKLGIGQGTGPGLQQVLDRM